MERSVNKSNLHDSTLTEMERRFFDELKITFQVEDKFLDSNRIWFSWDSKYRDGTCVLARLDRTYAFIDPGGKTSSSNYRIFGNSVHLDHLQVWQKVWLATEVKQKSTFIMSA